VGREVTAICDSCEKKVPLGDSVLPDGWFEVSLGRTVPNDISAAHYKWYIACSRECVLDALGKAITGRVTMREVPEPNKE